ncbi:MAG: acyl-CoA dehydrogenase family protein [Chloroflexi bacterium]|nr:acyl-CoA dehydrogenase family protein [Chloroflexota bacterium]
MEFRFTQEQEDFRKEVRSFLRSALPPDWKGVYPDGYFHDEYWHFIREFTAKLVAKGWLTITWPKEYGGQALPHDLQTIYNEELAYNRAPHRDLSTGIHLVGPTVMIYGTDEQKRTVIPPIAAGEHVYCQGFSEPGSGSDLASLQMRAVRDGDEYVVNGSKIWTSGAHRASHCILLTRTDPEAPKHKGISMFLVDMKTPGITVRPILNPLNVHYFNEVFFDDVRVPATSLIGEENRGWYVATTTLDFERSGVGRFGGNQRTLEELAELMVGRKVLLRVEKNAAEPGSTVLEVENLSLVDERGVTRVDGVSLSVRAGEIVGIAGVAGNGQSELLAALAGILPIQRGRIAVCGGEVTPEHPRDAREMREFGLAHVPEDRLRMGLVGSFEARESSILGYHRDPAFNGPILTHPSEILADCRKKMSAYDVRPQDPSLLTANFSGGNQQKIVLAREMERHPDLLLVGQPTRGVDIGAVEFIHKSLIAMRDAGCAVLLVSVELDEILSLSDRILVMFEGRIVGEVAGAEATERTLGLMMAGVVPEDPAVRTPA